MPGETEDPRRAGDPTRSRGDRASLGWGARAGTDDEAERQRVRQQVTERIRGETRVRGIISAVMRQESPVNGDRLMVRFRFADTPSVLADLGPRMTLEEIPVSVGERVSLHGLRVMRGEREVLVVRKIIAGGRSFVLRGESRSARDGRDHGGQRDGDGGDGHDGEVRDGPDGRRG